ncbi:MAG TPA: polysaccharide biosynthesis C-terminal domain-containing protein [Acidimicrobiia bacterium]
MKALARSERHQASNPRSSKSLIGGTTVLLSSRAIAAAFSLAGTVLVAHALSLSKYGSFVFVFTLLGLLGLLADFETTRVVLADLANEGDDQLEAIGGRFFVFRIALGTVGYALALLIVVVGPYTHQEIEGVAIGGLSFFIASGLWAVISVCQARLWLRAIGVAIVVGAVVQLAVIVVLYASGAGTFLNYIVAYVLSDAVALVVILIAIRNSFRVRPRVDLSRWRRWVAHAAPLAVGTALGTLYFRVDSLMLTLRLSGVRSRDAVALYNVGYKFSDLLAFLAPALMGATLPLLVRAWPSDSARFRGIVRQTVVIVVMVAAFATALFGVLAQPIIHTVFPQNFTAAAAPARWLVAGQALNFLTQISYVTLVSVGRRGKYPIVTLLGLVLNVALNWWLIGTHGVMGAAVATVITEVFVLVLLVGLVRDLPVWPLPWRAISVVAISTTAAAFTAYGVERVAGWIGAATAATVVYLGALHVLGVDGPGGLTAFVNSSRSLVAIDPSESAAGAGAALASPTGELPD